MSRKDLTLAERIALLNQIKKQPPNTSYSLLAKITGTPKSTIARLIIQEDKLREEWTLRKGQQRIFPKRRRSERKKKEVEETPNLSSVIEPCVRLGPISRNRSEETEELVYQDFQVIDIERADDEQDSAETNLHYKTTKIPRKDMKLAEKIALLDQIKIQPPNTSYSMLAKITGTPKSTIARLIIQEDKLRAEWALRKGQQETPLKRRSKRKHRDVDETTPNLSPVTVPCVRLGPILRNRSEETEEVVDEDFQAIDIKKAQGDQDSADTEVYTIVF